MVWFHLDVRLTVLPSKSWIGSYITLLMYSTLMPQCYVHLFAIPGRKIQTWQTSRKWSTVWHIWSYRSCKL